MLKYPRQSVIGDYDEYYQSEEAEDKATEEYFKRNKARHSNAIKQFVNTFKGDNNAVVAIKNLSRTEYNIAYWGYTQLYTYAANKEKVVEIGNILNELGGMKIMQCTHYLFAWDIKAGGMCIGGQGRVIEHWWNGIGDWLS